LAFTASVWDPQVVFAAMSETVVAHQPGWDVRRRARALVRGRNLLAMAAACVTYWAAAKVGYELEFAGPVAAIVWLPVGVGIAFLYLGGLSVLPGIIVGDLIVNDYGALPLGSALGQSIGNILEMVVATLLLRRFARGSSPLDSVVGLAGMVAAIAIGTAVSATIGPLSLFAGGVVSGDALAEVWRTWWLGDATGALVIVPLALAWWPLRRGVWDSQRLPEGVAMLTSVVLLAELGSRTDAPLAYLVFPALIWAALRFRQRGATLAVFVACGVMVWNTTHYSGPFHFDSVTRSVLNAQLFIAVAALSTLCLAAVVAEREAFAERLGASRAQLFRVAEAERRRIERNLHDGAQQRLLALVVNLRLAAERTRRAPEQGPALFADAESELVLAVDELRDLAHGMHPTLLTTLGLGNAVRSLAARSTLPIMLTDLPEARFDDDGETTAYYVVAEAIANAQKHAYASGLWIRVVLADGTVTVDVVDDGIGGASAAPGSGLDGLRERVEGAGGTFSIYSPAGQGTRIRAAIPVVAR
jgi:signal transduction histidine kinase